MLKQFSHDWFSGNIKIWSDILNDCKGKPDLHFLEVGCWEGRATTWLLENILTDQTSRISVVDTFVGDHREEGHDCEFFKYAYKRFVLNTRDHRSRVNIHKGPSSVILKQMGDSPLFDFAYIDASHTAYGTLEDAVLVHPLLKKGSIIIFDDYGWRDPHFESPTKSPKLGIDSFAAVFADFYEILLVNYQVVMRKKH